MISKKLQSYILKEAPFLAPICQTGRNMFYIPPVDHILNGFFIDKGNNFSYIGTISHPMTDNFLFVTPGFGGRLEQGVGAIRGDLTDMEVAVAFVKAIREHLKLAQELNGTQRFLDYFGKPDKLENIILRRMYASVKMISGDNADALLLMNSIAAECNSLTRKPTWMNEFLAETESAIACIIKDPSVMIGRILEIEFINKNRFNIIGI